MFAWICFISVLYVDGDEILTENLLQVIFEISVVSVIGKLLYLLLKYLQVVPLTSKDSVLKDWKIT